jgi:hypothetical protein
MISKSEIENYATKLADEGLDLASLFAVWDRAREIIARRTENIVTFPEPGSREDYFGVCPICQRQNGYLNDGPDHWFVCNTHMTKWCVGSNLFSGWRHLTKEESFAQVHQLTRYRTVKEFHPEKPDIVPMNGRPRRTWPVPDDDDLPF